MILALIENAAPKTDIKDSGHYRLHGDPHRAKLHQACVSTIISSGNELERLIEERCKYPIYKTKESTISQKTGKKVKAFKLADTIQTFEDVIYNYFEEVNSYFPLIRISKEDLKTHTGYDLKSKKHIEIDGLWVINGKIFIAEYKDGSAFDTKKSDSEIQTIRIVTDFFKSFSVDVESYIVCWNLKNINDNSFKSTEVGKYIVTGRDFSKIVELDFDLIVRDREKDQKRNNEYLVKKETENIAENNPEPMIEVLREMGYKIETPV